MDFHQVAYLFAIATGIVSSGAIGSLWAAATFEAPSFGILADGDFLTPIKVPVIVLSAPTTLIVQSFKLALDQPLLGILLFVGGLT